MTNDEMKYRISQLTGIPADCLNGTTAEENITKARAMLEFKKEYHENRIRTPREQFADAFAEWYKGNHIDINADSKTIGGSKAEAMGAIEAVLEALTDLSTAGSGASPYPNLVDSGEVQVSHRGTTREQFAEWIAPQLAFNPFKDDDGWEDLK